MLTINQEKQIRRMRGLSKPSRQEKLEELASLIRQFRALQKDVSTGAQAKRKDVVAEIDARLDELKIV